MVLEMGLGTIFTKDKTYGEPLIRLGGVVGLGLGATFSTMVATSDDGEDFWSFPHIASEQSATIKQTE